MVSIKEQFEIPAKMKTWAFALIGIGAISVILGFILHGTGTEEEQSVFWGTVMYNSMYFTMICNAAMFFICAITLAMGGWHLVFQRVGEAISVMVPIFGTITFIIFIYIIYAGHLHGIYHWIDKEAVANDKILSGKSGFLNPTFFVIWSALTILLWSILGARMRKLSDEADAGPMDYEKGKHFVWRNTVTSGLFIVWFALTVGSVTPWFWIMSLDAHWYSTLFSWYTFASTFVSGIALITLWVIYLKNKGYLEYTNEEHLHDLGKFIFAFSIFWTYLWFAQYLLIWYANIPEETIYFKPRVQGVYKGVFFFNLIINFVCPILILMKNTSKRNYTVMTFMAVLIVFGHWIDFYQMVMPSISKNELTLSWLDFGVAALFIGLMIHFVGKALAKKPLVAKYHPYLKESVIHHT